MEKLLQYIWKYRLWEGDLTTHDGERVRVFDPGVHNFDEGPDFCNARISIGNQMWAGNIEIHVRASDWKRHNHHIDANYDSIILHVVEKDDMPIYRSNGERIPQCVLKVSPQFMTCYEELMNKDSVLPCSGNLSTLSHLHITEWLEALLVERLNNKLSRIEELRKFFRGSWEDTCYVTLARALGFGINGEAFEQLSRITPLAFLRKHCDSLSMLEAMLFGQAGVLNPSDYPDDTYFQHLCSEYAFLRNKFSLTPMNANRWKFFRIRPQNFPHRRIAMLAQLCEGGFTLFTDLVECKDLDDMRNLLSVRLSGYWTNHYAFGMPSQGLCSALTRNSIDTLIINVAIPLIYSYARSRDMQEAAEMAITLLEELKPEKNSITERFKRCGINADSAFMSQALIQLFREYCEPHRCTECRFGHRILSKSL